jgi:hypothetical protein
MPQVGKKYIIGIPRPLLFANIEILPPFQIVVYFSKSRYIIFTIYLDIVYISKSIYLDLSKRPNNLERPNNLGGSTMLMVSSRNHGAMKERTRIRQSTLGTESSLQHQKLVQKS